MTSKAFSLLPFSAAGLPVITIGGTIARFENRIALSYLLAGNIEDLLVPPHSREPRRKDELWKATCFEMFLAIKDQPRYWEFNFSPSGDWNVYRMDAYRRDGFGEEISIPALIIQTNREDGMLRLATDLDVSPIVRNDDVLQVGLCAVIQTADGNETYWALAHPDLLPDFHRRESFILELGGQTQPSVRPAPAG